MPEIYRCSTCAMETRSPYYFRTPTLCQQCFKALDDESKAQVATEHPTQPAKPPPAPLSNRERSTWQRVTRLGVLRFVLLHGVVEWGVTMLLLNSYVISRINHEPFEAALRRGVNPLSF